MVAGVYPNTDGGDAGDSGRFERAHFRSGERAAVIIIVVGSDGGDRVRQHQGRSSTVLSGTAAGTFDATETKTDRFVRQFA